MRGAAGLRLRVAAVVLFVAGGCAARVDFSTPQLEHRALAAAGRAACDAPEIDWFDRSDVIERDHERLGELFVGEDGMTARCGLERMKHLVRVQACRAGADAVVMLAHRPPSPASTCHQFKVGLVRYVDGRVHD